MLAVPDALSTIDWLTPPLMLYVTVAFGVPVKVTVAPEPEQMVVFAAIDTTGSGKIVMVILPETGCIQVGVPPVATLTNEYVVVME